MQIGGVARTWSAVVALVVGSGSTGGLPAPGLDLLRDGDVVFQRSRSAQAEAIAMATGSPYTHVGIVVFVEGHPLVFEALATARLTPYASWVQRGRHGHVVVKRLRPPGLSAAARARMRALGRQMRGRPYDLGFRWDDDALYCTELVYKLYERGAGVQLGELRTIREHDLSSQLVREALANRGLPLDRRVLSPQSMFEDQDLVTIFSNPL